MTKVDFQVLCLQVGGGRKISEVQVEVCVGGCCVLKPCKDYVLLVLNFPVLIRHPGLRADSP